MSAKAVKKIKRVVKPKTSDMASLMMASVQYAKILDNMHIRLKKANDQNKRQADLIRKLYMEIYRKDLHMAEQEEELERLRSRLRIETDLEAANELLSLD